MAKNTISQYSTTNSSNTDIQSVDISEGCSPAGINNAIREIMVDLAEFHAGTQSIDILTVDTRIVPDASGGADIGTASAEMGDVYIADDKKIQLGSDQDVTIQYDETTNDSLEIAANVEGAALGIVLKADQGDDAGDEWKLNIADGGTLTLGNDIASAGSYVTHLTVTPNSTVANSTVAVAGNITSGGDVTIADDLTLDSDGAVLSFGDDQDVKVTHVHNEGLQIKHTGTSDNNPVIVTLQSGETDIAADDVIGQIDFQAPDEGTTGDSQLVAAGIAAISEGDFSSSSNATKLSFKTGSSETATEKMSLSSAGLLTVADDIKIKDGGTIGNSTTPAAVTIASNGNVTLSGDLTVSGDDLFMGTNTSGHLLIADGTNFNPTAVSGDVTINSSGTTAIGSGVIVNADVNSGAAIEFSKMENLTASRALVSDGSGDVSVSAVTSTELAHLDGVSSAIQTQLDAKASTTDMNNAIAGLRTRIVVEAASTANVNLSNGLENGDTLDGVTLATGDAVLLKDQSTGSENGIYTVVSSGAASRSTEYDAIDEISGQIVVVNQGSTNDNTIWLCTTNNTASLGSDGISFTKVTPSNTGTVTSVGLADGGASEFTIGSTPVTSSGNITIAVNSIADTKLGTIATANKVSLTALNIDAGTDIGEDLTSSDLIIVDNGADGTNRKSALSRVQTLIEADFTDASTSAKGRAQFSSDNFAASSGTITIKSGGVDLTDEVTGALPVANGGTALTSFTSGDILYASGSTTLAKLNKGSAGQVLQMNSGASAPEWATASTGISEASAIGLIIALG